MLKVHQIKGDKQGDGLSAKLPVNKHRKSRKAKSRQVTSHFQKQGRYWITDLSPEPVSSTHNQSAPQN
jgi:hypothetical protein